VSTLRDIPLPDLVADVVTDARELVEAQVSSLKSDLGDRMSQLGDSIRSWLVALCVAIVTAMLLGLAIAATLTQVVGLPWFVSQWIVTAIAIGAVVWLVYRARASGKHAARGAAKDIKATLQSTTDQLPS